MIQQLNLLSAGQIIAKYMYKGVIDLPNGYFICPLREGDDLRFLHKIYKQRIATPTDDIIKIIDFSIPEEYKIFISEINGFTLFDNTFSMFGIVDHLSRGLRLEDQAPVCLNSHVKGSAASDGQEATWMTVGSIAGGQSAFSVEISCDGLARISDGVGNTRVLRSLDQAILLTCELLDEISNESGLLDDTGADVDKTFEGFLTIQPS